MPRIRDAQYPRRRRSPSRPTRRHLAGVASTFLLLAAQVVSADDATTPATQVALRASLAPRATLGDIEQLERSGPKARQALEGLVRAGQEDAVADRAIAALGLLAQPESLELLARLRSHRRVAARQKAYAAIARIADPRAVSLLGHGLRDGDASVRAGVALSLAERGDTASVPLLFVALERGVPEAAIAIGEIGDADSVARYATYLGKQPLDVMLTGYERFLARKDLDVGAQLAIVATLEELGTAAVSDFFQACLHKHITSRAALLRALAGSYERVRVRKPATDKRAESTP